jgi:hypothetical protein
VTQFFDLNHRVHIRNEIASDTRNILKKLKIPIPKQLVRIVKQP